MLWSALFFVTMASSLAFDAFVDFLGPPRVAPTHSCFGCDDVFIFFLLFVLLVLLGLLDAIDGVMVDRMSTMFSLYVPN